MKFKELVLLILLIIPLAYLGGIWESLPQEVPLHWNAKGEIDRIGSKNELLIVISSMTIPLYIILSVIPFIDPKKKVKFDSKGYYQIRLLLQLFIAVMSLFIIHATVEQSLGSPNLLLGLVGALFIGLGYTFNSIHSNYFIGIRTPWTLEDPENWKKTHALAAPLWKIGGGVIMLLSLVLSDEFFFYLFMGLVLLMAVIPIGYSFWYFKKSSN